MPPPDCKKCDFVEVRMYLMLTDLSSAPGVRVTEKHPVMQYREGEPLRDLRKYLGEGQEDGQLVEVCQLSLISIPSSILALLLSGS
jgi:hypothetical protein